MVAAIEVQPLLFGVAYLVLINWASASASAWDKLQAEAGGWRISESNLLLLAFIGGSVGTIAAQRILRHKTRKQPFRTFLHLITGFHVLLLAGLA